MKIKEEEYEEIREDGGGDEGRLSKGMYEKLREIMMGDEERTRMEEMSGNLCDGGSEVTGVVIVKSARSETIAERMCEKILGEKASRESC